MHERVEKKRIPNSTWKSCGHPVYLGTSKCELVGCGEAAESEQNKAGVASDSGADFKLPPLQSNGQHISLEVYQQDWVPGFTAFLDDGELRETGKAHLMINIGGFLSTVESGELPPKDLPYLIAESLMHEAIHALEAWAKVEFSEERVEELLQKYRLKYRPSDEKHWHYEPEAVRDNSNQFELAKAENEASGEPAPIQEVQLTLPLVLKRMHELEELMPFNSEDLTMEWDAMTSHLMALAGAEARTQSESPRGVQPPSLTEWSREWFRRNNLTLVDFYLPDMLQDLCNEIMQPEREAQSETVPPGDPMNGFDWWWQAEIDAGNWRKFSERGHAERAWRAARATSTVRGVGEKNEKA